ncbi:hypothetical protein HanIR_Chr03g0135331 [Helianthus annuus]|nr:hypothetical protein HanIR_Chr03g0135331 [Helianthus annuus]
MTVEEYTLDSLHSKNCSLHLIKRNCRSESINTWWSIRFPIPITSFFIKYFIITLLKLNYSI